MCKNTIEKCENASKVLKIAPKLRENERAVKIGKINQDIYFRVLEIKGLFTDRVSYTVYFYQKIGAKLMTRQDLTTRAVYLQDAEKRISQLKKTKVINLPLILEV